MNENKPISAGDCESPVRFAGGNCNSPMRETFQTRMANVVAQKRKELQALEQLQKIADKIENGSPLEELLWSLTNRIYERLL